MTLIEWLRVQLDADRRVALEAAGVPWTANVPGAIHVDARAMADNHALRKLGYVASVQHDADRAHIAAWDPARVLAEVKAKRAILDEAEQESRNADNRLRFADHPGYAWLIMKRCVEALAQPYAGRDGWQDEWSMGE